MPKSRVFYQRNHVFATVLHNQICEGHIMLAPIESGKNYSDLTNAELFETVLAIKELSQLVKTAYSTAPDNEKVTGTSVVVQEFEAAKSGQTSMNHLRVHIVPRRKSDNRSNEDIQNELDNFAQSFM